MKNKLFGVGVYERGKYVATRNGKSERPYALWGSMLRRCYSELYKKNQPTYEGVEVSTEFFIFQDFAEYITNVPFWNAKDDNGNFYAMDKDVLGNGKYDKGKICFIPQKLNNFLTNKKTYDKSFPTGVSYHKKTGKYQSLMGKNGKLYYIGLYNTPEEARYNYCIERNNYSIELANEFKGKVIDEVIAMLENYNEGEWSE